MANDALQETHRTTRDFRPAGLRCDLPDSSLSGLNLPGTGGAKSKFDNCALQLDLPVVVGPANPRELRQQDERSSEQQTAGERQNDQMHGTRKDRNDGLVRALDDELRAELAGYVRACPTTDQEWAGYHCCRSPRETRSSTTIRRTATSTWPSTKPTGSGVMGATWFRS